MCFSLCSLGTKGGSMKSHGCSYSDPLTPKFSKAFSQRSITLSQSFTIPLSIGYSVNSGSFEENTSRSRRNQMHSEKIVTCIWHLITSWTSCDKPISNADHPRKNFIRPSHFTSSARARIKLLGKGRQHTATYAKDKMNKKFLACNN